MSVQVEAGRLDHTQGMFCGFMCISQEVYVGSQTPGTTGEVGMCVGGGWVGGW